MNQQQLNKFLEHPANLNYEQDLPVIKEMIDSFPYFAGSYIILSKLLHQEKSIYLDKYLKLSAAYIGNREVLYNYLHKVAEPATAAENENRPAKNEFTSREPVFDIKIPEQEHFNISPIQPENHAEPLIDVKENSEPQTTQAASFNENPVIIEEIIPDNNLNTAENELNTASEDEKIAETDAISEEESIESDSESKNKEAESPEEIKSESQATPILNKKTDEISKPDKEEAVQKPGINTPIIPVAAFDYFASANFSPRKRTEIKDGKKESLAEKEGLSQKEIIDNRQTNIHHSEENKIIAEATPLDPDKKYSFTEWLDLYTNKSGKDLSSGPIKTSEEAGKEIKKEAAYILEKSLAFTDEETAKPVAKKVKRSETDDLISKFIQAEPKIKKPQQQHKFFTPEDVAQRSIEEDGEIATETLAKIYIKQELYSKAIEIYSRLSLKFPAKSRYFADKIAEIKKLQK